jgi:hypothetical protein
MVNMERCRWTSNGISKLKEFVVINIPAYRMSYYREGQEPFISDVVVGKEVHKTVVFSGMMKYIVFSPYWNVPKSIVKKEIEPGLAKNSNYLEDHDMERNGNQIRQKPGPKIHLGSSNSCSRIQTTFTCTTRRKRCSMRRAERSATVASAWPKPGNSLTPS